MSASVAPEQRNRFGFPKALRSFIRTRGHVRADTRFIHNEALPWLVLVAIVSCTLAGVSMGLSVGARDIANEAKRIADRENRLLRLEVDELRAAVSRAGINIHDEGVERP